MFFKITFYNTFVILYVCIGQLKRLTLLTFQQDVFRLLAKCAELIHRNAHSELDNDTLYNYIKSPDILPVGIFLYVMHVSVVYNVL